MLKVDMLKTIGSKQAQLKTATLCAAITLLPVVAYSTPKPQSDLEHISSLEPFKHTSAIAFSQKYRNLTLEKAYNLQKAFAKNSVAKGAKIIGYKASLVTKSAFVELGLQEPITGVLLQAPLTGSKPIISLQNSYHLVLEQKLAFKVKQAINEHLTLSELKLTIAAVALAVEMPDVSFHDSKYNGLDVIANNALAYQFVIGDWHSIGRDVDLDVDNLSLSLSCNDRKLNKTESRTVAGSQWDTLLWMVNHLIDQGYKIKKDQVLITGILGKAVLAKPCHYLADYGELGHLQFEVMK